MKVTNKMDKYFQFIDARMERYDEDILKQERLADEADKLLIEFKEQTHAARAYYLDLCGSFKYIISDANHPGVWWLTNDKKAANNFIAFMQDEGAAMLFVRSSWMREEYDTFDPSIKLLNGVDFDGDNPFYYWY